uniref:GDCCVxC domain-containing (seleno)protein n=1 Tax=Paraburkholderia strydomiana TaxID=1245417 RepID=UPI0038BA241D
MPTNACVWSYECQNCKTVLRPKSGDCRVYCSYGTSKCRRCSSLVYAPHEYTSAATDKAARTAARPVA